MIGHPPRSTLFPSTTLSRSVIAIPPLRVLVTVVPAGPRPHVVQYAAGNVTRHYSDRSDRKPSRSSAARRDRKSTRLNSSHANISYAVFCLKKKKNNYTDDKS